MIIAKNQIIERTNNLISEGIKQVMKQENLTIEEFAERTGLRVQRVKNLINKAAKRIFLSEILKIVRAFKITFKEFFSRILKETTDKKRLYLFPYCHSERNEMKSKNLYINKYDRDPTSPSGEYVEMRFATQMRLRSG